MKLILATVSPTTAQFSLFAISQSRFSQLHQISKSFSPKLNLSSSSSSSSLRGSMSWLGILGWLGFGNRAGISSLDTSSAAISQGKDDDMPAPGQRFAQFGAGCFWGVELAFQRVLGVTKTEVGYSQGLMHDPSYEDVCTGTTNHSEVVRVLYDPNSCRYEDLLHVFWARHDPTTLNQQALCKSAKKMNSGQLISLHPEELTFEVELEKPAYCNLILVNNTEHHVAFKVKTTSPKKYFVRPNTNVVQPWDSCTINVTLKAQKEYPIDMQCADKFLLQSTKVLPSIDFDEIPPDTFTKDGKKVIEECKLRVVYVSPQSGHPNSAGCLRFLQALIFSQFSV